ncbi:uncharacterized protein LOC126906655 [Daktulosphaira vitifoliae]|uniref:uncharacterized protein LOC126906655 n=1 Tax=Daktulosphaira vitifoliae TaxID=58002 RepID=UPI0021AAA982|nr:uncharacterized protein LOC126906655 [Daktulosphaira vitifoliae]
MEFQIILYIVLLCINIIYGAKFEAFYPREAYGVSNGASRSPHGHGSFYKYRNPALIDAKNSPAYGYRFDGKRRFNFDR